jgi:transposase InsO family protein
MRGISRKGDCWDNAAMESFLPALAGALLGATLGS